MTHRRVQVFMDRQEHEQALVHVIRTIGVHDCNLGVLLQFAATATPMAGKDLDLGDNLVLVKLTDRNDPAPVLGAALTAAFFRDIAAVPLGSCAEREARVPFPVKELQEKPGSTTAHYGLLEFFAERRMLNRALRCIGRRVPHTPTLPVQAI